MLMYSHVPYFDYTEVPVKHHHLQFHLPTKKKKKKDNDNHAMLQVDRKSM